MELQQESTEYSSESRSFDLRRDLAGFMFTQKLFRNIFKYYGTLPQIAELCHLLSRESHTFWYEHEDNFCFTAFSEKVYKPLVEVKALDIAHKRLRRHPQCILNQSCPCARVPIFRSNIKLAKLLDLRMQFYFNFKIACVDEADEEGYQQFCEILENIQIYGDKAESFMRDPTKVVISRSTFRFGPGVMNIPKKFSLRNGFLEDLKVREPVKHDSLESLELAKVVKIADGKEKFQHSLGCSSVRLTDPIFYFKKSKWELASSKTLDLLVPKDNICQIDGYLVTFDNFEADFTGFEALEGVSVNKTYQEISSLCSDCEDAIIVPLASKIPNEFFVYQINDRNVTVQYNSNFDKNDCLPYAYFDRFMSELEHLSQPENIGEMPCRGPEQPKISLDSSNPDMGRSLAPKLEIKIGESSQADGQMNMAALFGSLCDYSRILCKFFNTIFGTNDNTIRLTKLDIQQCLHTRRGPKKSRSIVFKHLLKCISKCKTRSLEELCICIPKPEWILDLLVSLRNQFALKHLKIICKSRHRRKKSGDFDTQTSQKDVSVTDNHIRLGNLDQSPFLDPEICDYLKEFRHMHPGLLIEVEYFSTKNKYTFGQKPVDILI
ncbi:unnamed protein product [Moneuplotes crassus]|uniref:Uncharacterized protein n=1 Tax=Euplotes crassus TaxID=5936 RepID=A0AAD1X725_EUPCR|nr:unnamed protein product [Moneuplotes crassus]